MLCLLKYKLVLYYYCYESRGSYHIRLYHHHQNHFEPSSWAMSYHTLLSNMLAFLKLKFFLGASVPYEGVN